MPIADVAESDPITLSATGTKPAAFGMGKLTESEG
jgi:hypothetical protein